MAIRRLWRVGDPNEVSVAQTESSIDLTVGVLELRGVRQIWSLYEDATPRTEMAAAVGLALLDQTDSDSETPNLMDQVHARAKTPIKPFLLRASIPVAATVLLALGLWGFNLEQSVELTALRNRPEALRPAELRLKMLGERIRSADIEIEHLGRLTEATPATRLDALVAEVAHCLPDDVWLKQFRVIEDNEAVVSGASYTEGGVYDLVGHLQEAPDMSEVALQGTGIEQTRQGPATSFDIDLELTAPATNGAPEGGSKNG